MLVQLVAATLMAGTAPAPPPVPFPPTTAPFRGTALLNVGTPADLAKLFTDDDYPIQAERRGEQGTVVVALDIGADGRVAKCRVTQTASPALDAQTCAIIVRRGRYAAVGDGPARRASSDTARITWRLPNDDEEPRPFGDKREDWIVTVGADGMPHCHFPGRPEGIMIDPAEQGRACENLVLQANRYKPRFLDRPYRMTIRTEQVVGEQVPPLAARTMVARIINRKRINAEGYVRSCEVVPEEEPGVDSGPWFNCRLNERFEPLSETVANRSDRMLTVTWTRFYTSEALLQE